MKLRRTRCWGWVLLGAVVLANWAAQAEPRFIRLRHGTIDTSQPERPTAGNAAAGARAASGLYLVQFRDHLKPAWRAALAAGRVELLQYVPDDAFVARLDGVSLQELRALPYVRWVGEYKPEHKLHGRLRAAQAGPPAVSHAVTVLLSPSARVDELAAARGNFQSIQQQTTHRFGTVFRGVVPNRFLQTLADSPAVLWIEPAPQIRLFDEVSSKIVGGDCEGPRTCTQLLGFDGAGVRVAVADSGLDTGRTNDMHPDLAGRVVAFFFYGNLTDASDEHSHGTHVAGIVAGNGAVGEVDESGALYGLGVASGASIIAQRMFDGDGNFEGPPFEVLTHDAVRTGADIGNNSWGDDTQGRYDVSAAEFDALVRDADLEVPGDQQYFLEFSAGNAGSGTQTIGSPAVAKNVIATGASQNNRFDFLIYDEGQEAMADFSSRGPAEDGRIKPDVVAPGTWIASLRSEYANDDNAWLPISEEYMYQGGTSQAGPHISGAAAVFIQYYLDTYASGKPSPALIKAALISCAVDMEDEAGTIPTPNMDEGWGRVDLTEMIGSGLTHDFIDQTNLLETGQVYERQIIISSADQPFKVTMAYTDYPGFPAVLPALVNDLDLEVVAPDGRVYRGNQFDLGESVPDAPGGDNLNNVECVRIGVPFAGEYRVRVIARNVVQDSRTDTPGVDDQDFALVISGDILPPEAGVVLLDRSAYRAPSLIQVKLYDADLMGQATANVVMRSATETNGLPLLLRLQPSSGAFTGSVATALGTATIDNKLQIAHGDWIRVEYFDVIDNTWRFAHATADLLPPVISQVLNTNRFGQTVVSWITDEPANAVVRYNTNSSLSRSATNYVITTTHTVELTNLIVGRMYFFAVESTDIAGNTTVTNNNGVPYTFVAQPTATVLLVNNYIPDDESVLIPLSTYTTPLQQNGVSYDLWNATIDGAALPSFNTLRPYPLVIWRVNDSFYRAHDSIPTAQQTAIQQYVNGGGSFFMASMEILSRLGAVPFRTNVLFCQSFVLNDPFGGCTSCDEDIGVATIEGETADPISRGILTALDYSQYPAFEELGIGPDLSDTFGPVTNAAPMLFALGTGKPCGIRYPRTGQDSTGRVVFCSFPLDAIPATGPNPNNRTVFLRRVLQFLAPGSVTAANIAFDHAEYHLPDLVTVEVSDADLAGGPGPVVRFHSDSDPTPIPITLRETPTPGVFRGFIPVVPATDPPDTNLLHALDGDRIYAEYFDPSSTETITAEAEIDNVLPVITGIVVTPGYEEARITWTTDEPADSLVQFGESIFLGRTAYSPEFVLDHDLTLTGLTPDHLYYFQVVSRDPAGNARVDNPTNFYTFRTLVPLPTPFDDTMDTLSTTTNWSVFSNDGSESDWQLGTPNNGVQTAAHSPPKCWGSVLHGGSPEYVDTYLISPAIELTGGNVATLFFWHNYDFTEDPSIDIFSGGEVLIFTNSLAAPLSLAEYYEKNLGWEQEKIDLTPYVGRVVFVVWHHLLFSIDRAPRAGWLVDDVEVVMSNVPPVTIEITNNLAQAKFTLTGQLTRTGQGNRTVITNAPPGTYTVAFNSVPYYITPPRQTNTLDAGGSWVVHGTYLIGDTNGNGLSDLWERQYWGANGANHNRNTDGDGDGFTDYAEFIAGTNPTLPNSHLRVTSVTVQPNGMIVLQWPSVTGRIYQVQGSTNLSTWTPLTSWIQAASGTTAVTLPATGPPGYYRLEVRP